MRPDWKSAPEWATWLARDKNGGWCWHETKPKFDTNLGIWSVRNFGRMERANIEAEEYIEHASHPEHQPDDEFELKLKKGRVRRRPEGTGQFLFIYGDKNNEHIYVDYDALLPECAELIRKRCEPRHKFEYISVNDWVELENGKTDQVQGKNDHVFWLMHLGCYFNFDGVQTDFAGESEYKNGTKVIRCLSFYEIRQILNSAGAQKKNEKKN